jgi:hypothetical protein
LVVGGSDGGGGVLGWLVWPTDVVGGEPFTVVAVLPCELELCFFELFTVVVGASEVVVPPLLLFFAL